MGKFTKENASVFGKKGGKQTKKKHGTKHFEKIGKKGRKIQIAELEKINK